MSTDFLFTRPTFRSGMASCLNFEGKILYNTSQTPKEADELALMSDWLAVGLDMKKALQNE